MPYHDFMQNRASTLIHLIKLIDAADTIVTQH